MNKVERKENAKLNKNKKKNFFVISKFLKGIPFLVKGLKLHFSRRIFGKIVFYFKGRLDIKKKNKQKTCTNSLFMLDFYSQTNDHDFFSSTNHSSRNSVTVIIFQVLKSNEKQTFITFFGIFWKNWTRFALGGLKWYRND